MRALSQVLRHHRAQQFHLVIDGHRETFTTPLLVVGNNRYSLDFGHVGERDRLDNGTLSISAIAAQSPLQLLGFALRAVCGLADPEHDFALFGTARKVVIEGTGSIEAAFDGEPAEMFLPLRMEILPGALGVVVPHEQSTMAQSAARPSATHPHGP